MANYSMSVPPRRGVGMLILVTYPHRREALECRSPSACCVAVVAYRALSKNLISMVLVLFAMSFVVDHAVRCLPRCLRIMALRSARSRICHVSLNGTETRLWRPGSSLDDLRRQ